VLFCFLACLFFEFPWYRCTWQAVRTVHSSSIYFPFFLSLFFAHHHHSTKYDGVAPPRFSLRRPPRPISPTSEVYHKSFMKSKIPATSHLIDRQKCFHVNTIDHENSAGKTKIRESRNTSRVPRAEKNRLLLTVLPGKYLTLLEGKMEKEPKLHIFVFVGRRKSRFAFRRYLQLDCIQSAKFLYIHCFFKWYFFTFTAIKKNIEKRSWKLIPADRRSLNTKRGVCHLFFPSSFSILLYNFQDLLSHLPKWREKPF